MKTLLICLASLLSICLTAHGDITDSQIPGRGAPHSIRGNGRIISQGFGGSGFSSIEVSSRVELTLRQSPSYEVRLETDENIMPYLRLTRKGDRLVLDFIDNVPLDPTGSIRLYVAAPVFTGVKASGACSVYSDGVLAGEELALDLSGNSRAKLQLDVTELEIDASGSSDIELKGKVATLTIDASGNTDIAAFGLKAGNADLEITGSGRSQFHVTKSMKVELGGSAEVVYRGAGSLDSDVSGRGRVMKVR